MLVRCASPSPLRLRVGRMAGDYLAYGRMDVAGRHLLWVIYVTTHQGFFIFLYEAQNGKFGSVFEELPR